MKTNKIIKTMSAFLSIILAVSASISVSAAELSSQQNAQDADMIIEYNDKKEYLQALEDKVKEQTPSYYAQCQAEREFHKAYLETFFQQVPYWDLEDNMLVLYPYKGIDTSIYTLEDFEEYGVIDIDIDASEYQPDIMVLTLDKHNRHNVIDTCLALMDMPSIFLAEPEIIPCDDQIYDNGDANLDGKITIDDATEIQKYLSGMFLFTPQKYSTADMNQDGRVTIDDATAIQKYLASE